MSPVHLEESVPRVCCNDDGQADSGDTVSLSLFPKGWLPVPVLAALQEMGKHRFTIPTVGFGVKKLWGLARTHSHHDGWAPQPRDSDAAGPKPRQ